MAGAVVVLLLVLVSPPPPVVDAPLLGVVPVLRPLAPPPLVAPPPPEVALLLLFELEFDAPEVALLLVVPEFELPVLLALCVDGAAALVVGTVRGGAPVVSLLPAPLPPQAARAIAESTATPAVAIVRV